MHRKTRLIILNQVKYGETSLVVTAFTELFGRQTYMVKGVRRNSKTNTVIYYQPAAILEAEVTHDPQKAFQYFKAVGWGNIYRHVFGDVLRNNIALFMAEVLQKLLKHPDPHEELYYFCEDVLLALDKESNAVSANLPVFFMVHIANFFGFGIPDEPRQNAQFYFDLREGNFTETVPAHADFLDPSLAAILAEIKAIRIPQELNELRLNQQIRRQLLEALMLYYRYHLIDFGVLKTYSVLKVIL